MTIKNIRGCVVNVTTFSGKMQKHASAGFVSAARLARSEAAKLNGKHGNGLARLSSAAPRVARVTRDKNGRITSMEAL